MVELLKVPVKPKSKIKDAFNQTDMQDFSLISFEDQEKLGRIFERYFEPEETTRQHVKICSEHCDKIFNTFDINNKSDKEKATYLLVIATIFVKLSS